MDWLGRFRWQPPAWDDRATEEDIHYAYRLILRRQADADGLADYRRAIAEGMTLNTLIRTFMNSDERRFSFDDEERPTPVDLGGYQVCVQKRDMDFGQAIFATRDYEPHVRQAVRDLVRPADIVVDVGANVGCIAFLAATLVGDNGLVIAVEPNPGNLQLLYAGVVLNRFSNVRILPVAASDRHAVVTLAGALSNTHTMAAREVGARGLYAQGVALDEWLGGLPRLDFVKLDIEGDEPRALAGLSKLVTRYRPSLLVEFNPRTLSEAGGESPRAFLDTLCTLYPRVRVLTHFGDDVWLEGADAVMDYWNRRNREVTAESLLRNGLLHFDLVLPRPD